MIVVADTSPLNYLILIPEVVRRELDHDGASPQVRAWIANPPSWLEVRSDQLEESIADLDAGESAAILLAEQQVGRHECSFEDRPPSAG
jgi:predicted nucleic acid-binding protein